MLVLRLCGMLLQASKVRFEELNPLLVFEILEWAFARDDGQPLKCLYRNSQYSEPTIRACLKALIKAEVLVVHHVGLNGRLKKRIKPSQTLVDFVAGLNRTVISEVLDNTYLLDDAELGVPPSKQLTPAATH